MTWNERGKNRMWLPNMIITGSNYTATSRHTLLCELSFRRSAEDRRERECVISSNQTGSHMQEVLTQRFANNRPTLCSRQIDWPEARLMHSRYHKPLLQFPASGELKNQ